MLWILDLRSWETPPAAWLEVLDEAERDQCQRFHRAKDRLAYAAAHALLRRALSRTLEIPPESIKMARDTNGKPFLVREHLPIAGGKWGLEAAWAARPWVAPNQCDMSKMPMTHFSLSHTEGMVAVAISEAGPVGVDVEAVDRKNVPHTDFSAFGLSSEETAHLAALSEPDRSETFIDLWTAREAVAKADGRGLSLPFARIRIDRAGNSAEIAAEETSPARRWRLWRERPSPRHRLALAGPEDGTLTQMGALL